MKNAWILLLVASAMGCGNPVSNLESSFDGTIGAVCESCPLAFGEATTEACLARTPALLPDETWDCLEDNYAMYSSELDPFWSCWNQAYDRYDRCVRDLLVPCPTAEGIQVCNDQFEAARDACPNPTDVEAAVGLGACFTD